MEVKTKSLGNEILTGGQHKFPHEKECGCPLVTFKYTSAAALRLDLEISAAAINQLTNESVGYQSSADIRVT